MQRASPRKRKQVFPQGSPPGSPSKNDMIQVDSSPDRRNVRRNQPVRSWEDEQQMIKHQNELLEAEHADDSEEKIEVDHVEEVEEELEEEEVEVDEPVEEEVVEEEYVDDFNIPLYAEDSHTIHVSGKSGVSRKFVRDYNGQSYTAIPRIHDGESQFGGHMRRKYRSGFAIGGPIPRPPVHLRTTDGVQQQPRARLLPVAVARPQIHHRYGQGYGGQSSMTHWREDQKRKMELLDIYESLPVDKQVNFLNYLNQTGESFIPPQRMKGRRSGEGPSSSSSLQTLTRVRTMPNDLDHRHHTVQVPAHMAREGAEILISPQPDGRTTLMSLIPVGEEDDRRNGMERDKTGSTPMKKRRVEDESREEEEEGEREEREEGEGETEDADTSDMPLLEADKEALEKRKEERMREREREREREWNGMEEDVDVENLEETERRMEEEEEEEEHDIPMLASEVRGRRGLFYVPELDGYNYEQRYSMCAPKMKGGLRLCESCNIYMRKSVFYHHQRTIREHGSCSAMTPKRFECGVPECEEKMPTIERLCVHMAEMHHMPTDVQETEFTCEDEFAAFLVELESKGGNFRMSRGNKCGKQGVVRYYRCNRVSNQGPRGRPKKNGVNVNPNELEELIVEGTTASGRKKQALVRTEKICTAFYRKSESMDGRISVRYCDFHLHEDVKVKLPDTVKERVMEMLAKKLPMPVIVEVIKAESEQYARLGSELERRIYGIGEKDVRNVYCTYLAKKRKEERNPCEEIGELNENESRFLMAFEKAEGKSIHEVAKGSKVTLERRRRRDELRDRVMHLQRFFKSDRFVEFSDAQLAKLESLFGALSEMCMSSIGERVEVVEDMMMEEEDIEEEEGERAIIDIVKNGGDEDDEVDVDVNEGEEGEGEMIDVDGNIGRKEEEEINQPSTSNATQEETPTVRKRGRPRKNPLPVGEEREKKNEGEGREKRDRDDEELDGEVKEEEDELEEELIRSPIVTSRGRLTKPKRFPGEEY